MKYNTNCHTVTDDLDVIQTKNCKHTKEILKLFKKKKK